MTENSLIIILGATASGKTKLAVQMAKELGGEIISADSRQIFNRMDIGTGKDLNEYRIGDIEIPRHLINILDPGERYNVDAFKNDFYQSFKEITGRNKIPILCGGTGMYIHSILQSQPYTAVPVNDQLRSRFIELTRDDLLIELNKYPKELTKKVDLLSKKRLIRAIEIAEYLRYNTLPQIERPEINFIVFGLDRKSNV